MKYTKEELEKELYNVMNDCLEGINADGSIKSCKVNLETKEVTFTFDIVEVPEDDYIGFAGY